MRLQTPQTQHSQEPKQVSSKWCARQEQVGYDTYLPTSIASFANLEGT